MPTKTDRRRTSAARAAETEKEGKPLMKWNRKTGIIAAGAAALAGFGAALFVRRRWRSLRDRPRQDRTRPGGPVRCRPLGRSGCHARPAQGLEQGRPGR